MLRIFNTQQRNFKNIKMLVFDMAGTTVNEKGIVYDTLYSTIKDFGINVLREDINSWYGYNKYEVLNHYLENSYNKNSHTDIKTNVRQQLYTNFDNNLREQYFESSNLELIDKGMPNLFNSIREKDIKICLNTGYSKDIQESIINKLNMKDFIDDYISCEEVKKGRPYPYMIHKLMERNNISHSKHIIKIGDTKNDILEGRNANCMASIGVLTGAEKRINLMSANAILNSVMDIKIE